MMGKIRVNNVRITKPGQIVSHDGEIRVKGENKYVSRGGLKLEGALTSLNVDVSGRIAIDAGASTGGFTDCLLQFGVKHVYAVDVGFGQLSGKLR